MHSGCLNVDRRISRRDLEEIKQRIWKKLEGWKTLILSNASKVVLIKSNLTNILQHLWTVSDCQSFAIYPIECRYLTKLNLSCIPNILWAVSKFPNILLNVGKFVLIDQFFIYSPTLYELFKISRIYFSWYW